MADITISGTVIPNYHEVGTLHEIRVFSNRSWIASDNTPVPGRGTNDDYYVSYILSVVGTNATVPAISLKSTEDALNASGAQARYTAQIYVDGSPREVFLPNSLGAFKVPASPTSTTWGTLETFNAVKKLRDPSGHPDTDQVQNLINIAVGTLNDASATIKGRTKLSIDPTGEPVAIGANDPQLVGAVARTSGVVNDAVVILDGAITSGTPTLTSASSNFSPSVVGKSVAVIGAGPSGATLNTTISARPNSTTLTLAVNANTTVSGARIIYGTDNKTPLQNALNAALAAGVKIVSLPKGLYFFPTGTIDIPQSITLQGVFDIRSIHRGPHPSLPDPEYNVIAGDATTFLITANEGASTGYFMRLKTNAAVKGVTTYYPAQIPSLTAPKTYPFNFELRGFAAHLENIEIGLAYQGIKAVAGSQQVIRNIAGQPLALGLQATHVADSSVFENIHFETLHLYNAVEPLAIPIVTGANPQPLVAWQLANGVAFKFGQIDNGMAYDLMAFGYKEGIRLASDSADGDGPAGGPWMMFSGGDLEAKQPLIVEDTRHADTRGGCSFVDYTFTNNANGQICAEILATFAGRLSLTNCSFSSNFGFNVNYGIIYRQGATGWLGVVNSWFTDWIASAIVLQGTVSVGSGKASIVGNRFEDATTPAIDISSRMSGTIIGNIFEAAMATSISNASTVGFLIRENIFSDSIGSSLTGSAVASAATITPTGNIFHVTGTTNITSVQGSGLAPGTVITIIFDGVLTFTDGNNLKLAGNFVTTADDTITLVFDGTNFFEICRSVN